MPECCQFRTYFYPRVGGIEQGQHDADDEAPTEHAACPPSFAHTLLVAFLRGFLSLFHVLACLPQCSGYFVSGPGTSIKSCAKCCHHFRFRCLYTILESVLCIID